MALPSGMVLRQMTVDDIPALAALNDETWEALYGRTGYITAELMELGLRRPNQDPERDNPLIVSDGRPIAWAALQAFPPMTEIVCPITVDLTLSPDARSASIDALIAALQSAARARLNGADASLDRVYGVSIPTRDTAMRDHVHRLGWKLLRTYYELAIDLTEAALPDVDWPAGVTMRTFSEADVVTPAIEVMNDAFADHHGDLQPPDEWHHMLTAEIVLPDASYLLSDADGPVAGLVSSDLGDGEGYIGAVGVRRRGRGRGMATTMLRRAFHDLAATGHRIAKLDVDGENTTGALRLYERAGMSVRTATEVWVTPLE